MNKKELVKLYIDTLKNTRVKELHINDALQELDEENWLFNIIPKEYTRLVDTLMLQTINHVEMDWISWWLYEDARGVSDPTGAMDLENFDEFYDFAFLDKTVSYIMEQRNEQHTET